ncbi:prepilin peptidase [Stakelama tenebrarum]|uniref:Prepilin leader peptidase/N-methyltransferase n=1 Tax=Stakelama tenebrarum TaxID=2711215 RepID=A0A6G6Y600_9SPHN|nr:A24 family peptidase [Sphingosinithalassobacter tenebrarum]QIG80148.1 prepilin peptidase [Sphingosinithalassobacter tenebrarum]
MTDWAWPLLLGVLGLVFGSFIATAAIRWPQGRSPLRGRSECDHCGRVLGATDLVPVLSYVARRGRCAACGGRIAPSHLATELLGGAIGVIAGFLAPGMAGALGAVFGWMLLLLAALDLAALWLPDILTGLLGAAGVGAALILPEPPLWDRLIGGLVGFGTLWLVRTGYRALRGREGLGGGDPKMFGAIGLWLGWTQLPLVLLAAALPGLALVLVMWIGGRRVAADVKLPFGVLLAVGAFAVWTAEAGIPPPVTEVTLYSESGP